MGKKLLKDILFRITALLFGLLLVVVALEISLALASVIVQNNDKRNPSSYSKDDYAILCVGDSFTFGTGVKKQYAYPAQLEIIIKNKYPKKNIKVINVGVPGANSPQMLKKLPEHLEKYSPEVVIIWAGVDNCWNLTESNYFLFVKPRNIHLLFKRVDAVLLRSRLYKLIKIAVMNLENKVKRQKANSQRHKEEIYFSKQNQQDKVMQKAYELCKSDRSQKQEILKVLEEAYAVRGDTSEIISFLKLYYPWNEFSEMVKNFAQRVNDTEMLREIERYGCIYKAPKKAQFTFNLNYLNYENQTFDRLLEYDLNQMILLAQKSGAQVVLLTYFSDRMERGGDNHVIRNIAQVKRIPCVDFVPIFDQLLREKAFEYYFVPDGHCNKRGYNVVATHIADALHKENFID